MSNFTIYQFTLVSKVSTRDTGLFNAPKGMNENIPPLPTGKNGLLQNDRRLF